jgi:hypothetical protein
MPYIPQENRTAICEHLKKASRSISNPGELNYAITKLADNYLADAPKSYNTLNEVIGAMEAAKLELYRRIAVPYENAKIAINGDAYETVDKYRS